MSKVIANLDYAPKYDYIGYLQDFKKEMELQRFEKLWGRDQVEAL